jgi:hypothetical protein
MIANGEGLPLDLIHSLDGAGLRDDLLALYNQYGVTPPPEVVGGVGGGFGEPVDWDRRV